jgi:hypothetical protein
MYRKGLMYSSWKRNKRSLKTEFVPIANLTEHDTSTIIERRFLEAAKQLIVNFAEQLSEM